jgi:hypothetical protein
MSTFQTLTVIIAVSRLGYGNGVLTGLPSSLVRRLQCVLKVVTRLIYGLRWADDVTDALITIH